SLLHRSSCFRCYCCCCLVGPDWRGRGTLKRAVNSSRCRLPLATPRSSDSSFAFSLPSASSSRVPQLDGQRPPLRAQRAQALRHRRLREAFREVHAPGVATHFHQLVEREVFVQRELGRALRP
ncbi:unnamed protein product, partial [Ectocarpus sp. 8 AP-2014]